MTNPPNEHKIRTIKVLGINGTENRVKVTRFRQIGGVSERVSSGAHSPIRSRPSFSLALESGDDTRYHRLHG